MCSQSDWDYTRTAQIAARALDTGAEYSQLEVQGPAIIDYERTTNS